MKRTSTCVCGDLEKRSRDPRSLISRRSDDGSYILRISEHEVINVVACTFCGGYDFVNEDGSIAFFRGGPTCTCDRLTSWASDPGSCVSYDAQMNEYSIEGSGIVYYCPACGGRAPCCKRGTCFTQPSRDEMDDFFARVADLKTISQVLEVLGTPDEDHGALVNDPIDRKIYGTRDVRRTLTYTRLWKSLNAVIQETEDGKIQAGCQGKPVEPHG